MANVPNMAERPADVLIIGGGLCGLSLAAELTKAGRNAHIVEARDRLGGRILTEHVAGADLDLGPAWFWQGQPRIARMIADLGLSYSEQFSAGAVTLEDEHGHIVRKRGIAPMQGSYRVVGGMGRLIDRLATQVPSDRVTLSTTITGLALHTTGIVATSADGANFSANQAVLALPPRLASRLNFAPDLPPAAYDEMNGIATWMAGQAKVLAVYETPFWRDDGLSGDAISHLGPIIEVHDASPFDAAGAGALFGFIGIPPAARTDLGALEQAVRAQLVRLFGPKAGRPSSLRIKDWAFDVNTSTAQDHLPLRSHPTYGLSENLRTLWNNRLLLSGTETAPAFGGYLEGALEASELALAFCATERT